MKQKMLIAAAVFVTVVVVAAFLTFRKESFSAPGKTPTRQTRAIKYATYVAEFKEMIPADVTVTKTNAMAILRLVHESAARGVRNPNAKRLHNAAMQQLRDAVADAFGDSESMSGLSLLKKV